MSGAGVAFIFSFLGFYSSSFSSESINAWGSHLFPVSTLITLFAVVAGAVVALRLFGVNLPDQLLTYTWKQVVLACGFFATVLALAFLLQDRGSGVDLGIGYWFMLLGSIAVLVGAIMLTRESAS